MGACAEGHGLHFELLISVTRGVVRPYCLRRRQGRKQTQPTLVSPVPTWGSTGQRTMEAQDAFGQVQKSPMTYIGSPPKEWPLSQGTLVLQTALFGDQTEVVDCSHRGCLDIRCSIDASDEDSRFGKKCSNALMKWLSIGEFISKIS